MPVGAGDDATDPSGDDEGTGSDVCGASEVDDVGSGVGPLGVAVPVGLGVSVVPAGPVGVLDPLGVADGEVELGVGSVLRVGVGVCFRVGSGCTCCCWPAGVVATVGGRTKL